MLWRQLYETAARATEALSIDVEDQELDTKRVRIRTKGGDTDWLHFETGSARLLPRLIAGRAAGRYSSPTAPPSRLAYPPPLTAAPTPAAPG